MTRPSHDPSVHAEGFHRAGRSSKDSIHDEPVFGAAPAQRGEAEAARDSVWDEPAMRAAHAAPPPGAKTYARWYRENIERTPLANAWLITLAVALAGGPFAIAGTLFHGWTEQSSLAVVLVGPVLEEMMKIAAAVICLENRPYLFRSPAQILVAALASALAFATIENVLYLYVYIDDPPESLRLWRWTVCTLVHVGATSVAAAGLVQMWRQAQPHADRDYAPPSMRHAAPFIVTAIVLHGAYNMLAMVMGLLGK